MTPNKFQHAGLDWIPHTPGDPMPCPAHVEVRIFQRCDAKSSRQELEVSLEAAYWNWSDCGASSIIGWHPIEEQPDPTETHRRAVEWHSLTDDGLRLRLGEITAQYRNGRIVGSIKAGAVAWGKLKHESGSDVVGYLEHTSTP